MKKLNLHFKIILLISAFFISSKNIYSQWTIAGDLAGVAGPRPVVSVVDGNTAFVAGGTTASAINATYKTTNGGANWIQLNTSAFRPFWSIYAKDANTVFAGDNGSGGRINFYKTTNGGNNWTLIDSISGTTAVNAGFRGIRFSNSIPSFGIAYAEGNNGDVYIYKTRDGGNTWTRTLLPGYPGFGITAGLNVIDSLFYAFAAFGSPPSIIITTDGGVTWNLRNVNLPSGNNNTVRGLAFKDKLTGIAGSSSSTSIISRTTNEGLNWVNIDLGYIMSNSFIGPIMRWIEGTDICYLTAMSSSIGGVIKGVLKSTNGGLNWTPMTTSGLGIIYMDTKRIGSNIYGYANSAVPGAFGGNQVLKLTEDYPLPVELSSFVSLVIDRNVKLNWTTSSETNNSGFEIERRNARGEAQDVWNKIGFVAGNGTTITTSNYSFIDRKLNSGSYNYRLKQIDYNGNFEYFILSNEVSIGVPSIFNLSQNYPNPFNPKTIISYQLAVSSDISIKVYDALGKEVATLVNQIQNEGYYSVDFDGNNFSSGVYFYKLVVDGIVIDTKRMVLLK